MKLIIFFICPLFSVVESILDRFGETKKGKIKDTLWLVIAAAVFMGLCWWLFDINPISTGLLILGWRVMIFDYLTHIFLKEFSESHEHINWFTYSGKTAYFDRIISKVNPRIRLVVRILVFLIAVLAFLLT